MDQPLSNLAAALLKGGFRRRDAYGSAKSNTVGTQPPGGSGKVPGLEDVRLDVERKVRE
jgi:hypothetical protein